MTMDKKVLGRRLVLTSASGLIGVLTAWFFGFSDISEKGGFVFYTGLWVVLVLPLIIALPGLLRQKIYTHQWVTMLVLLHFSHGIMEIWGSESGLIPALLEVTLSASLFIGCILWLKAVRPPREKQAK
ncbi:MAG: putative membrane protein [Gammaproteobacteria bacterium]|jgi:uncharacterized membrane protein